jgi:N utilization substance protein B
MLERRKARHQALHILYQREITEEALSRILSDGTWGADDGDPSEFCRQLLLGVESHQASIDALIEKTSEHWVLSRMPLVDRNILRVAVFELLYLEDVPDSVSINEAVEMAKVYGGEDSSKFVNGILGRLAELAMAGAIEKDGTDE